MNPGHIGGRQAISPLHHTCSPFTHSLHFTSDLQFAFYPHGSILPPVCSLCLTLTDCLIHLLHVGLELLFKILRKALRITRWELSLTLCEIKFLKSLLLNQYYTLSTKKATLARRSLLLQAYLTIRPAAQEGYGSIAHEAKQNGLLTRGPWGRRV